MNFLKFEDKVKKWIENNRVKWCFMLFFMGVLLGSSGALFLGAPLRQVTMMAFVYGSLLPIVELTSGGEGII